jgi:hypothetical protein
VSLELGVGGRDRDGEKEIWPLRGWMFCVGPCTSLRATGCPGATFPPLLTHSNVAVTESAVRNAAVGPFPSPAAFPLQVRTPEFDVVHVGCR